VGIEECRAFAMKHPICFMASMEGFQPRVRPLIMWFADQRGFYFMTLSPKEFAHQLHLNPRVEVCFYNGAEDLGEARDLRITGTVEFVDDADLVHRVAEERAALADIIGQPLDPITEVFRIPHGAARFWTIRDLLKEPQLETVEF
jgi:pyridoxamine 5'-phosphate oxidase